MPVAIARSCRGNHIATTRLLVGKAGASLRPRPSRRPRRAAKWQMQTGYGKRAKAETAMARYKRILGDHLHARKLPGQQAEAALGVAVLNRMIEAGRPESVRIA